MFELGHSPNEENKENLVPPEKLNPKVLEGLRFFAGLGENIASGIDELNKDQKNNNATQEP